MNAKWKKPAKKDHIHDRIPFIQNVQIYKSIKTEVLSIIN